MLCFLCKSLIHNYCGSFDIYDVAGEMLFNHDCGHFHILGPKLSFGEETYHVSLDETLGEKGKLWAWPGRLRRKWKMSSVLLCRKVTGIQELEEAVRWPDCSS